MLKLMLCLLLFPAVSQASDREGYLWGIFRHERQFEAGQLGAQLQIRHSNERRRLVEEQINLDWTWDTDYGEVAVLFTFGTQNAFEKLRELRYAVQWEKDLYTSPGFVYDIRLRQEVRDFQDEDDLAYRFRMRNEILAHLHSVWWLEVSSEFNWYQNSLSTNEAGFSSHRTIVGVNHMLGQGEWGLGYVNDYRTSNSGSVVRHILAFNLVF